MGYEENMFLLLIFIAGISLLFGGAEAVVQFIGWWQHRRFERTSRLLVLPKTSP